MADFPTPEFTATNRIPERQSLRGVLHAPSTAHHRDLERPFRIADAKAGEGRIELHRMRVAHGETPSARWIPMRSNNATMLDGLKAIAGSTDPAGADPKPSHWPHTHSLPFVSSSASTSPEAKYAVSRGTTVGASLASDRSVHLRATSIRTKRLARRGRGVLFREHMHGAGPVFALLVLEIVVRVGGVERQHALAEMGAFGGHGDSSIQRWRQFFDAVVEEKRIAEHCPSAATTILSALVAGSSNYRGRRAGYNRDYGGGTRLCALGPGALVPVLGIIRALLDCGLLDYDSGRIAFSPLPQGAPVIEFVTTNTPAAFARLDYDRSTAASLAVASLDDGSVMFIAVPTPAPAAVAPLIMTGFGGRRALRRLTMMGG
ncbi:hypothetical protein B0H13DRAFT_2333430 [Mycena leptocephala]|nr:hypothetical protein B0H13DRAFT_2333430 [Mycena leptocephala]